MIILSSIACVTAIMVIYMNHRLNKFMREQVKLDAEITAALKNLCSLNEILQQIYDEAYKARIIGLYNLSSAHMHVMNIQQHAVQI